MAMHRRLAKELPTLRAKTLQKDGLTVEEAESSGSEGSNFVALLAGPRDSPFEGGVFRLEVSVSPRYPLEPPKIRFQTRMFHPNVGSGHTPGAICLDILRKEAWSPALSLERVLISIASLLADPNPLSPMDDEAARLYQYDRPAYDKRVKEFVRRHAQPSSSGSQCGAWQGDMGKKDALSAAAAAADATSPAAATSAPEVASPAAANEANSPEAAKESAEQTAGPSFPSFYDPVVIDLSDDEDEPAAKRLRS
eukprot:TRINITY_DN83144_c0_g1_i1.p1 TRINITY_DN83144_c0_g1~~TRINITY_DN83144_c0_g1_i1.p1  ORF type:complete len:274 (-),score=53.15 TRINITY_DN83144_c0_g1_i1:24-779(-)